MSRTQYKPREVSMPENLKHTRSPNKFDSLSKKIESNSDLSPLKSDRSDETPGGLYQLTKIVNENDK